MDWILNPPQGFMIGGREIPYYGILVALGMFFGLLLCSRLAKKRGFKDDDIWTLALFVFPLAILGARIYYCVFSGQQYTFAEFWHIWDGGIAVYGSIIGGAIAVGLYCVIFKKNFWALADIVVVGVALGQAIGRIGCYFGHCCYGKEAISSLQFFPISIKHYGVWHYATFFYESLWNLIGMFILLRVLKISTQKGTGLAVYLIWYGFGRALIEGIRGDSLFIGSSPIRVSQALSVVLILVGVALLVFNIVKKRKGNGQEI